MLFLNRTVALCRCWDVYLNQSKLLDLSCLSSSSRPYGGSSAAEAPVHENPEWEKARQALASISKSQSSTKTAANNHTSTQVRLHTPRRGYRQRHVEEKATTLCTCSGALFAYRSWALLTCTLCPISFALRMLSGARVVKFSKVFLHKPE